MIQLPKIHITAYRELISMTGSLSPDLDEIRDKLDNWRRFYRVGLKIESVSYYTPPRSGSIVNEEVIHNANELSPELRVALLESIKRQKEQINTLPPNMQEAVKVEMAWRNLEDQAFKWFLKWVFVDRIDRSNNGCFILWRRMKQYGIRLRSYEQQEQYERRALIYFENQTLLSSESY